MFRRLFLKKSPLTGVPPVRRMKTYSAQSGYVYQYFFEGYRDYKSATAESNREFVFSISADRKNWDSIEVLLEGPAILEWQTVHTRELSATERYAIAKMALFQAFDERSTPDAMKDLVRIRYQEIEAIASSLDL